MKPCWSDTIEDKFHTVLNCCFEAWKGNDGAKDQKSLARLVGVHPTTLNHWLNNRRNIEHSSAVELMKVFCKNAATPSQFEDISSLIDAYGTKFPDRSARQLREVFESENSKIDPPQVEIENVEAQRGRPENNWPGPITFGSALIGLTVIVAGSQLGSWFIATVIAALIFTILTWFLEASLRYQKARDQVSDYFLEQSYAKSYKLALSKVLDRTDDWFLNSAQQELGLTALRRAWTVRLYAKAVLLALIYPLLAMMFQWAALDRDVWFGETILLHDTQTAGKLIVVALFAASFSTALFTLGVEGAARYRRSITALVLAVSGLLLLGLVFGPPQDGIVFTKNWFMGTLVMMVLFAFILLCHFRKFHLIIGPAMGMVIGAAIQSIYSAEIEALAAKLVEQDPSGYLIADGLITAVIILFITIFCAVPLTWFLKSIMDKPGWLSPLSHGGVTVMAVVLMAYGAGYLDNPYYFIMLGILPVVNATFDFGSIGLTRWALRSGLTEVGKKTLLFSGFDLVAAIMIFIGLGCFFILVFHLVNFVALNVPLTTGIAVVNLNNGQEDNIFHQLAAEPERYWWLYATLLTTLLPTLVHACVAIWALGPTLLRDQSRVAFAERFKLAPTTVGEECARVYPLAFWATFALVGPAFFMLFWYGALADNSCHIGIEMINVFVRFFHVLTRNAEAVALLDVAAFCVER